MDSKTPNVAVYLNIGTLENFVEMLLEANVCDLGVILKKCFILQSIFLAVYTEEWVVS
jgi:hypothetical protein